MARLERIKQMNINLMLKEITKEQNEKIKFQNETIYLLKDKTNRLNGILKESNKIINLLENSLKQSREIINLLENSLKDSNETIDDLRKQIYFWENANNVIKFSLN